MSEVKTLELSHTFYDPWDDKEVELTFHFQKPSLMDIKRMQKTAAADSLQASRDLLLSTVISDERDALKTALDTYAGIAATFVSVISKGIGLSADLGK